MNKEAIKQTLNTQGWKEIESILREDLGELRMAKNISKKKSYQDIAIEALGKAYASRTIERWLTKIKEIGKEQLRAERPSFK